MSSFKRLIGLAMGGLWAVSAVAQDAAEALTGELLVKERTGYYYFARGDVFTGMNYLLPVAEAGYAPAQFRVAEMEYAATNFDSAFNWHQRAYEQGYAESAARLAHLYRSGEHGGIDLNKAFELEIALAKNGRLKSMLLVAAAYESGSGVEQSDQEALAWYRRAADAGSEEALGVLLRAHELSRWGLTPDPVIKKQLEQQLDAAILASSSRLEAERKAIFEELRQIELEYLNRAP